MKVASQVFFGSGKWVALSAPVSAGLVGRRGLEKLGWTKPYFF